ncbi:SusC/RagA family TonB-linked outer membrane protein [Bizionia argentinensis JUB59]|uniref:SusC/RagA family TonB-linked outer membrane protein n=1 Tax=Bizionia argentinensis JUB59 TaxID=1046627 RepID=G2EHM5_9FLAO|nr:TonB-dependent receptor [Bizionia argentinensis]EGV42068.1 SusC/RagA family TonB-linked outer membrane protein [Bizionia argentinensis JUB59]
MKKQRIRNVLTCILNQSHLKMKFTILFVFISLAQISAHTSYGQKQKVTLSADNASLTQVFQEIETQTDLHFFYNSTELNVNQTVSLHVEKMPVIDLLEQLFLEKGISFQFFGSQIVLKKLEVQNPIQTSNNSKKPLIQQRELEGSILDSNGFPIPGVSVIIEGTQKGTVTNFEGIYKLLLDPEHKVIVVSSLAYQTERIVIGSQTVINVTLKEDLSQLEEIVLIGYGKQKRENVTGAVSSIKSDDIVQAATGSVGFDRALGGLVKGVQVSQPSGRPGSPVRLNIRGVTSPLSAGLTGGLNQPLYVIDGVPFNQETLQGASPLLTINPNDIESFDILKDAASTSIYGSRGANGVIIIQTKKGKRNNDPKINFSYTTTFAKPINTSNVLDANQYRDYYSLLINNSVNAMNAGQLDPFFAFDLDNIGNVDLDFNTFTVNYTGLREDYFGKSNTDWSDVVFRSAAVTKQANVGLTGGSENTNYNFSLAFVDQEGLTVRDGLEQYTTSLSLDTDVSDYVTVGGTVNLSHVKSESGQDNLFGEYTVNSSIARARPDLPVYDENGQLYAQPDFAYGFAETYEPNPLMRLQNKTNEKSYNFIGNTYIEIEPLKDLKIKADVNAAVFYTDNSSFIPKISQADLVFAPVESYLLESKGLVSNVTTNLTANYKWNFGNHDFSIMGGTAWDRTNFDNSSGFYSGFPDEEILINATSASNVLGYSNSRLESGLNSLFSRLTYSYKNRYNATINWRADTSSKFSPDNQTAYFPSLSASWNASNEEFLTDSDFINTLRLRASVGRVGSTNVADFAYIQFLSTSASDVYNGESAITLSDIFPNENIGWETTEEVNLGLDFALFNSRLRGNIDAYSRKTSDALVKTPIPLELGPSTFYTNFIDVTNKGIEVSLGGDIIRTEDFTWSANVNWAFNRNELTKINGSNINQFLLDYFIEGEPVGTIKGYKVAKIFQSQDEVDALNASSPNGFYDQQSTGAGDYMFEDTNGDGEITSADRTIIGNIEPDFFGGFSNTFVYKNFSVSAFFQYSVGAEASWNAIGRGVFNSLGENKYSEYALNTWTPENTDARYARALYFDPSESSRMSDRYLYDTSYLRLKSLQLSYSFDRDLMKKVGVESARLMITGTNLFTWTKFPGIDPEALSERGTISDQTSNEDPYPLAKSVSLGIQMQF